MEDNLQIIIYFVSFFLFSTKSKNLPKFFNLVGLSVASLAIL